MIKIVIYEIHYFYEKTFKQIMRNDLSDSYLIS